MQPLFLVTGKSGLGGLGARLAIVSSGILETVVCSGQCLCFQIKLLFNSERKSLFFLNQLLTQAKILSRRIVDSSFIWG